MSPAAGSPNRATASERLAAARIRTTTAVVLMVLSTLSAGIALPLKARQGATSPGASGVPVEQEPRHHVVFENASVKVIDAQLPAHDVTLYHTHTADNVPVVIHGGTMTVQPLGGERQPSSPRTGDASFARGGYTHQIANTGAEALHFVDVEIRAPAHAPASEHPIPAGHQLVLDRGRVRLLRHVAGGPSHAHERGLLAVVVPSGHDWAAGVPAGAPSPGTYWWQPPGEPSRLVPSGTETIEIEVK